MEKRRAILEANPHVFGLAYGCPKGKRKQTCPLIHIQNMTFANQVKWLFNAKDIVITSILENHANCSLGNDGFISD